MNVLFITNMFPNDGSKSSGIFVQQQAEALKRRGHRVDVLHVRTDQSRFDYLRKIPEIIRTARMKPYDVVHAHYGLTGFSAVFQRRVPTVVTYYGSDLNIFWQRWISRIAHYFSGFAIVQNAHHKAILKNHSGIIPCGIDAQRFVPIEKNAARKQLGLKDNTFYLLFPSSKKRWIKNYPLFASVLRILKQRGIAVEELTFENIDGESIVLFMNAADVMVMTSLSEGSPVAVKEALACSLPVVTVHVGDVAEVLAGVDNCSVTSRDPNEIADSVAGILASGNRSRNGRERAVEYDWETVAQRIETVYGQILMKSNQDV
jgi:glycosyltransferase involved in cell wall biosynthesis